MHSSNAVCEVIDIKEELDLLDMDDLIVAFDRTLATIQGWRKHSGLPYISIPLGKKQRILFRKDKVITWAESNGKIITNPSCFTT